MNPICFYHNADFDGLCSAAIVYRNVPGVELVGINYGDVFDFERVRGRKVYMVDFSLQPYSEMQKLFDVAEHTTWIDHHKSAIKQYTPHRNVTTIFPIGEEKVAACWLAWEFFEPAITASDALQYLSKYDTWDDGDQVAWENKILPFQFGLRMEQDTRPESIIWNGILFDNGLVVGPILERGKTILQYQVAQNEKLMAACAFDAALGELRALVVNAPLVNSRTFSSKWDPSKYDVMVSYCRRPSGKFTVSLYSDKPEIDCSVEAKKRGGGGHKGAAGFQCETLPWDERP